MTLSEQMDEEYMTELEARIVELEAALKPFAEAAEGLDPSDEDGWLMWEHPQANCVSVGDFRAASKAFMRKIA